MASIPGNNLNSADKLVLEAFGSGLESYTPKGFSAGFVNKTPERYDEKFDITAGGGTVSETTPSGAYTSGDVQSVGSKTMTQRIFKDQIDVTKIMKRFDNYGSVIEEATKKGYYYRIEQDDIMAAVFRNAFISTGTHGITIDGTAYPLVGDSQAMGNTGSTQDNKITGGLGADTFDDAFSTLQRMKDHNAKMMPCAMDLKLVVDPYNRRKAKELMGSPNNPEGAERNINVDQGAATVVVWELLGNDAADCGNDDSNNDTYTELKDNWFVVGTTILTKLRYLESIPVTMKKIEAQANGNDLYQFDMALVAGAADYLGIVGSNGT